MNEKNKNKIEVKKFRALWTLNPVTKIVKSKKVYDRKKEKREKNEKTNQ